MHPGGNEPGTCGRHSDAASLGEGFMRRTESWTNPDYEGLESQAKQN